MVYAKKNAVYEDVVAWGFLCYTTRVLAARNNREIWEIQKIISVSLPCSTAQIGFLQEDCINIAGRRLASEAVLGKAMWF